MNTDTKRNDRLNLEPETLQDLQVCLYDWQNFNFGDQDNELTLLGICEEAGELCHSQLKLEQNIRGDAESHENKMIDSIGDIMIYSMNYLSGMGEKINSFTPRDDVETVGAEGNRVVRRVILAVFKMAGKLVEKPDDPNNVRKIVHQLVYLCALKGWDLEKIIRETWKHVGQRNWRVYPDTGYPPDAETPQTAQPQQVSAAAPAV